MLFSDKNLVSGLNRKEFKKFMEIATEENMFMLDEYITSKQVELLWALP